MKRFVDSRDLKYLGDDLRPTMQKIHPAIRYRQVALFFLRQRLSQKTPFATVVQLPDQAILRKKRGIAQG